MWSYNFAQSYNGVECRRGDVAHVSPVFGHPEVSLFAPLVAPRILDEPIIQSALFISAVAHH